MVDGPDGVAVGIEHEGGVVVRTGGALAWPAVVAAAGGEHGGMEGPDRLPAGGLKCEVEPARRTVRAIHEQLVRGEMVRLVRHQLPPERPQGGAVRAPACLQVADPKVDVVEEAAEMARGQGYSPS